MAPWVGVLLAKGSTDTHSMLIHSKASLTCNEEVDHVVVPGNDTSIVLAPVPVQESRKLEENAHIWQARAKCTLTLPTGKGFLDLYRIIMGMDEGAVIMAELPAGIKLVFPRNEGSSSTRSFFGWLGAPRESASELENSIEPSTSLAENDSPPSSGSSPSLHHSSPVRVAIPSPTIDHTHYTQTIEMLGQLHFHQEVTSIRLLLANPFHVAKLEDCNLLLSTLSASGEQVRIERSDGVAIVHLNSRTRLEGALTRILETILYQAFEQTVLLIIDGVMTSAVSRLVTSEQAAITVVRQWSSEWEAINVPSLVSASNVVVKITGEKFAAIRAACRVYEVTSALHKISASSSPSPSLASSGQYLSLRVLLPRSARLHYMMKIAAAKPVLRLVFHMAKDNSEYTPLYISGSPHVVREALVETFKEAIQFYHVPTEEMKLMVQFKWYQMETQDVCSFSQVAARSGCIYFSDPTEEICTFCGNIYNIQAALSYMVHF